MKTIVLTMRKVCNIDDTRVMKEVGDTAELDDATAKGYVESGWAKYAEETPTPAPSVENREQDLTTQKRETKPIKRRRKTT
jgi:hypothetical protein